MTEQSPEITPSTNASENPVAESADPIAAHRTSRRTWFAVAAGVLAGVAVVGGSAYAIGASTASTSGSTPKAAFTLSNTSGSNTSGTAAAPLGAPGTRDSKMSAGYMMPFWGGGHTTFTAGSGLSSSASSATAYAFDASGLNLEKVANDLAKTLGVDGTATLTDSGWTVGPQDGSAANLTVGLDGTAYVNFYDPSNDPFSCGVSKAEPPVAVPDSSGNSSSGSSGGSTTVSPGASTAPSGPDACNSPNNAPLGSKADAIAAAKDVITAMGLNPADFNWNADEPTDSGQPVIYVSASLVVDGQLTGNVESFTFGGGNKLSGFYGFAAPLTSLGSYDVVSAQDAVARMSDPKFGPGYGGPIAYANGAGGVTPMAKNAMGMAAAADATVKSSPAPKPTVPTTPSTGSKFSWPVTNVTIVKADLGVAQYYQPNGSVVLLPTYQLTGSDKSTWTVIAVTDSALDMTPPPAQ